mmetsp:Transcript_24459/g.43396  ORF Transcript_24459/g.43396 Transcript_24459/m.43396 type:complete len:160 (+) Transcript_24459:252-731(+)
MLRLAGKRLRTILRCGRSAVQRADFPRKMYLSGAVKEQAAADTSEGGEVSLTETCSQRLKELKLQKNEDIRLRVRVDSGGCSGFQYEFELEYGEAGMEEGDTAFEHNGETVVVDEASMEFLKGSTIDYEQELIGSKFVVLENPNSEAACGCGTSFSPKL